jgi:N-acetylglucosamine-6-sulfatase
MPYIPEAGSMAGAARRPGAAWQRRGSVSDLPEQEDVAKRLGPVLVIIGVIVLAMAGCTPWVPGGRTAAAPRPNFVFVLTDDLSMNLVSHMPHVLALEQAGLTMSHYYVVDSLCCPSRTSIFTGEYPHDDGVFTNTGSDGGYHAFNAHGNVQNTFAMALQKSGYRTALMGKYLNGYQAADLMPAGWYQWDVAGNGYPEFNYNLNETDTWRHYSDNPQSYLTDVLSAKAGSFIKSAARSGGPFMLEVATFAPHQPYTPAPRYLGSANYVSYPKTAAWNRLPQNPPSWLKGQPPLNPAWQARITRSYQKRVEADLSVDDMIAHLESVLRATGQARNTYFVFSSDNGYHMGEYQLLPGKQTAFDTDIHVPLVVTGPGVPAGTTSSQLASNIDLAPTFESLAGVAVPGRVDGHSLAPLWHGRPPADWRQAILIEHHGPDDNPGDPDRQNHLSGDPPSYEAVRTANALYVRYASGEQEYYDTARDPLELDNIAGGGVPADLRRALTALSDCHGGRSCWAAAHL